MNTDSHSLGLLEHELQGIISGISADIPEVPEAAGKLAYALNDMLTEAEERFGGRLPGYTLGSILFAGNHPRVWSPSLSGSPVYLYLSMRVLFDLKEDIYESAYWTMAHETVHLLSRTKGQKTTVLEEGIACWFQKEYTQSRGLAYWEQTIPRYAEAEARFTQLLEYDEDLVKKLRQSEPTISLITAENICLHCPRLPTECAEKLASLFA